MVIRNDLREGRDNGRIWVIVINVSAALTIWISITGLVLIFWPECRRWPGLLIVIAGTIILAVCYNFGVS